MQPSNNESQILNKETDSEINSINDEISSDSCTNVFSKTSLSQQYHTDTTKEEITALEVKKNPKLECYLQELIIKYTVRSVKKLQKIIYNLFIPDGNEFDKSLHHDFDFINYMYQKAMSCALSDKKNFIRMINDQKKIDYKRNRVFRLYEDFLEFGAIEADHLINQKDDVNLKNFLNDSDEQDEYHMPPLKVNTTPMFKTPKITKTK
ncbi:2165_t:CDS:2, partial [Cetraspora pellucida]